MRLRSLLSVFAALLMFATARPSALMAAAVLQTGDGDPELPANGYQTWMLPAAGPPPMGTIRIGSTVVHLIDGPATFKAMIAAMETATNTNHFIYLAGWWLTHDFRMRGLPGTTMGDYLSAASGRGVEIRSMLSAHLGNQNAAAVAFINGLVRGAAIHDNRHLNFGSHHQKVLVVYGTQGLIAFVGGIDVNPDRILMKGVGANVNGDTEGAPFNDVHSEVRGPTAWDLLNIFVERWKDHPSVGNLPVGKRGLRGDTTAGFPVPGAIGGSTLRTQVGRTYGNSTAHAGVNPVYAFAPTGAQQCARMIMKGIGSASRFIYIEDQYFVDTTDVVLPIAAFDVRAALTAALGRGVKVIVLILSDSITAMGGQTAYRRAILINALRAVPGGAGFRVFYRKRPGEYKSYVHSKCWIFDDEYAIIGSANTNRRSWTHDSEAGIGVWDRGKADKSALYFAHQLRIALWTKHLGTNNMKLLKDGMAAQALWNAGNMPKGSFVVESTYPAAPPAWLNPDLIWNNVDPEGS